MALRIDDLRREFPAMLKLAAPLALAELGWMVMGIVDMLMAGPLGPAAIGATGLAAMLFYPIVISGAGLAAGDGHAGSRKSYGAGDPSECRRTLVDGCWLALALAAPLVLLAWSVIPVLAACGVGSEHSDRPTRSFLRAMLWGIPPLLFYFAFRRYLQAVEIVKPVTFALISANAVNFLGNYALIYGHWGFPRLGLAGSGYSTSIARLYMAGVLVGAVVWNERRTGWLLLRMPWRPHLSRLRRLAALGGPAALQILVEGAVFGIVSAFAARLDEASLAAHGLAINVTSTTYMIPLGVSSAAAVRVGHAVGRRDRRWHRRVRMGCTDAQRPVHGRGGSRPVGSPSVDYRALFSRCFGAGDRSEASADRRRFSVVRRSPGDRHRRVARLGRYAHADGGALGWLLGGGLAVSVYPLFFHALTGRRNLDWPVFGDCPNRLYPSGRLAAEDGGSDVASPVAHSTPRNRLSQAKCGHSDPNR